MSILRALRHIVAPIKQTPLHPQWLSWREDAISQWLTQLLPNQRVLDVGCNDRWVETRLHPQVEYFGLDLFTAGGSEYRSHTNIWGDVQNLPIQSNSMDAVCLFDVLEHIPDASRALQEIARVLKPEGQLLLQIPYLYPLHDEPYDFRRWSTHGLMQHLHAEGFRCDQIEHRGSPLETACLLLNIGLARGVMKSMERTALAALLIPLIMPAVVLVNLMGWLGSKWHRDDGLMPFSYHLRAYCEVDAGSAAQGAPGV